MKAVRFHSMGCIVLLAVLTILGGSPVFGSTEEPATLLPEISGGVGYQLLYMDYTEDIPGGKDIEIDGFLHGAVLWFTYHAAAPKIMVHLEGEAAYGRLEYDGQTIAGSTPINEDSDDYLVNARLTFGYDFTFQKWVLTPYLGIAGRYWRNDIDGPGAYLREILYFYSPVGIEATIIPSRNWRIALQAESDLFWLGRVKSHLSDVDSDLPNIENDQDAFTGFGLRGSVLISWDPGPVGINFGPFIRYWYVDDSNTETITYMGEPVSFFEPENETVVVGFRIALQF